MTGRAFTFSIVILCRACLSDQPFLDCGSFCLCTRLDQSPFLRGYRGQAFPFFTIEAASSISFFSNPLERKRRSYFIDTTGGFLGYSSSIDETGLTIIKKIVKI